jgi:hypothetical protein
MEHLSDQPIPDHGSADLCATRHHRHVERSLVGGQDDHRLAQDAVDTGKATASLPTEKK